MSRRCEASRSSPKGGLTTRCRALRLVSAASAPSATLLASSKACDAIMAVRIPPAAHKLRELVHCAQIVQSHALSFFYLPARTFSWE